MNKYLGNFSYFYNHLGYRVFLALGLNISVGVLDGLGLTMFLPLLQMVDKSSQSNSEDLGGLSFMIDTFTENGIELSLVLVLGVMVAFFALKGLAQYFNGWYRIVVQQYFIKNLRINNVRALSKVDYETFAREDSGRIQNTLSGEVDKVSKAYQGYFQSFQFAVMVVIYMIFAFLVDPQFAVLVSVGGLLTNLIYKQIYLRTKGASRKLTKDANTYQGIIMQYIANFKYLKSTGTVSNFINRIFNHVHELESNNRRIGILTSLLTAAREPLVVIMVAAIIFVQTTYFGSSLGPILVSLLFFYRALTYLMMMQNQWNMFLSVSGALENMQDFSDKLNKNEEPTGELHIDKFEKEIKLENVSLQLEDKAILQNINLQILKNETIAFVGESGGGKSSLVNVICGLIKPTRGTMTIDGVPRSEVNMGSFQNRIGYITQDAVIFNDTLYNNITLWAEKSPENMTSFKEVIKKTSLNEYLDSQELKEDKMLENAGINLSGGQKQRISIARELFKDIDILIMDEATSSLDSETESDIQKSIDELKGKYTMLVVAHRLSTVRNANRIIMMDAGKIERIDSFENLVESSPKFKKMVELQEI